MAPAFSLSPLCKWMVINQSFKAVGVVSDNPEQAHLLYTWVIILII